MSLINTTVAPFKTEAFHNGKFVTVSEASLQGKWSVLIFMPAAFTFNCPTEIEDAANNYAEFVHPAIPEGFTLWQPETPKAGSLSSGRRAVVVAPDGVVGEPCGVVERAAPAGDGDALDGVHGGDRGDDGHQRPPR